MFTIAVQVFMYAFGIMGGFAIITECCCPKPKEKLHYGSRYHTISESYDV